MKVAHFISLSFKNLFLFIQQNVTFEIKRFIDILNVHHYKYFSMIAVLIVEQFSV